MFTSRLNIRRKITAGIDYLISTIKQKIVNYPQYQIVENNILLHKKETAKCLNFPKELAAIINQYQLF